MNKITDIFSDRNSCMERAGISMEFHPSDFNWDRECWFSKMFPVNLMLTQCNYELPNSVKRKSNSNSGFFFLSLKHFNVSNWLRFYFWMKTHHRFWLSVGSCFQKSELISNFQHIKRENPMSEEINHRL